MVLLLLALLSATSPVLDAAELHVNGLGWIGKTALFVSPQFGPAVRLATVFTDLDLPAGDALVEGNCGDCRSCVDACPAGCGRDVQWRAGMPRSTIWQLQPRPASSIGRWAADRMIIPV